MFLRDVNIIEYLKKVVDYNTEHYKIDFIYDIAFIQKAAASEKEEDKILLWISRPNGTNSATLADAFIDGSTARSFITGYNDSDGIVAYLIRVKAKAGSSVIGDMCRLKYKEFCRTVLGSEPSFFASNKHEYIPVGFEVTYENEEVEIYSLEEYNADWKRLANGRKQKDYRYVLSAEDDEKRKEQINKLLKESFSEEKKSRSHQVSIPPTDFEADWFSFRRQKEDGQVQEISVLADARTYTNDVRRLAIALNYVAEEYCESDVSTDKETLTIFDLLQNAPASMLAKYGIYGTNGKVVMVDLSTGSGLISDLAGNE